MYQYLPYLRREGIRSWVIPVTPRVLARKIANNIKLGLLERTYGKIYNSLCLLCFIMLAPFFDVLFIQKVILPLPLVRLIGWVNKRLIFDFDDAVFMPQNATAGLTQAQDQRSAAFLRYARQVVVSNDFLSDELLRAGCANVSILSTPVDVNRFSARTGGSSGPTVIGWIGSPWTARYLFDLKSVFEALAEKYPDLRFEFIGADDFCRGLKGYTVKEWSFAREAQDLRGFDIGIMPLRDDQWCRGKAGYKLLQYMASGIATISSPVGVNRQIVVQGVNGLLAASPEEWLEGFCLLINDPELRGALGRGGRKTAQESYSYEVNSPKLIDILKRVAKK